MTTSWRGNRTASQCLAHLCLNESMADVHFVFETDKGRHLVPAHKFVLSMRSPVFETMFNGSLPEKSGEVLISDIKLETFKTVLRFIYTDTVPLFPAIALQCLYAAEKYCLVALTQKCTTYLESITNYANVCTIMNQAQVFNLTRLKTHSQNFICENAGQVVQTKGFATLSRENMQEVLKSDDLNLRKESMVFTVALAWAKYQCNQLGKACTPESIRDLLGDVLYAIRFPLIPLSEFTEIVIPTGVLQQAEELELYRCMSSSGRKYATQRFSSTERRNVLEIVIKNGEVTGDQPLLLSQTGGQKDDVEIFGGQLTLTVSSKRKIEKIMLITDGKSLPATVFLYRVEECDQEDDSDVAPEISIGVGRVFQRFRYDKYGAYGTRVLNQQQQRAKAETALRQMKESLVEKCNVGFRNEAHLMEGIILEENKPTTLKIAVAFQSNHYPRDQRLVHTVEKVNGVELQVDGTNSWIHSFHLRKP